MNYKLTHSTYIMEVSFDDQTVKNVKYKILPNYPIAFRRAAFGVFYGRSWIMGGEESNGKCYEFDQEEYHPIPSLNVNRSNAASAFIRNKVIIAGGVNDTVYLDSIEILRINESNHGSQWYQALSKLPIQVHGHTMVTCNDRLYLIGGDYDGSGQSDKIWEGTLISEPFEIIWKGLEVRLQKKRVGHFSFVISNTIIIFGGRNILDDFVEIIEDNKLRQGARVPFELNTFNDPAVLDRKNRVIITSKKYGLIVYDHQNETIQDYPNVKLRKERNRYATIIQ